MPDINNTQLRALYNSLLDNNYDVPDTYDSFEKTLTEKSSEGDKNRQALYNSLKENNYDVPDNYDSFHNTLFEGIPMNNKSPLEFIGTPYQGLPAEYQQALKEGVTLPNAAPAPKQQPTQQVQQPAQPQQTAPQQQTTEPKAELVQNAQQPTSTPVQSGKTDAINTEWTNKPIRYNVGGKGGEKTTTEGDLANHLYQEYLKLNNDDAARGGKSAYDALQEYAMMLGIEEPEVGTGQAGKGYVSLSDPLMPNTRGMVETVHNHYMKKRAREAALKIVTQLPSEPEKVRAALNKMWYDKDFQQQIVNLANRAEGSGVEQVDNFREKYIIPALQQALNERFGDTGIGKAYVESLKSDWDGVAEGMNERAVLEQLLKQAYAERDLINKKIEGNSAGTPYTLPIGVNMEDYKDIGRLETAKNNIERTIRDYEFALNGDPGFWGGIIEASKDPSQPSFGLSDILEAGVKKGIKDKLQENTPTILNSLSSIKRVGNAFNAETGKYDIVYMDSQGNAYKSYALALLSQRNIDKMLALNDLTESEKLVIDTQLAYNQAQQLEQNFSSMYKHGYGAGQSIWYMLSFAPQGGFSGIAKSISRGGTKLGMRAGEQLSSWMLKNTGLEGKALSKALQYTIKGSGWLGGTMAAGAIQSNTYGAAHTWSDILNRYIGNLTVDSNGIPVFKEGESLLKSVAKGEATNMFENASELMGDGLEFLPKVLMRYLRGGSGKMARIFRSDVWRTGNRLLKRGGVTDFWGEFQEEIANGVLNASIGEQNWFYNDLVTGKQGVFNPVNMWDTFVSVGLTCGLLRLPQTATYGYQRAQYYGNVYNLNQSDKRMKKVFDAERYNYIKSLLDNTDNKNISGVMNDLMTKSQLTPEEKQAVIYYAGDLLTMRGFNLANMMRIGAGEKAGKRPYTYVSSGKTVTEVAEDGSVINTHEYEDEESAKAGLYELQKSRDEEDTMSDISVMKTRPNNQYGIFMNTFCEDAGIEPSVLEGLLEKDVMTRTDDEQEIVNAYAKALHEVVYDNTVIHEEQSAQDGEKAADEASMEIDNPIVVGEHSKEVTDGWLAAKAAYDELLNRNEVLAEEINVAEQQGLPSQAIISRLDSFSDEEVQIVINYFNQKARYEGFMNEMGRKIEEASNNFRTRHTFTGTINGSGDRMDLIEIVDNEGNKYTLVSGNITTNDAGEVIGSESGMLIGIDENGDFVTLNDKNITLLPIQKTLDDVTAVERERLEQSASIGIDSEQRLMPQQAANETSAEEMTELPVVIGGFDPSVYNGRVVADGDRRVTPTEGGDRYEQDYLIDGKHKVTVVEEPNSNGNYARFFAFNGEDYTSMDDVISEINVLYGEPQQTAEEETAQPQQETVAHFVAENDIIPIFPFGEQTGSLNIDGGLEAKRVAKSMLQMFKSANNWQELHDKMYQKGWGSTVNYLTYIKNFFEAYKRGEITDQEVEALFDRSIKLNSEENVNTQPQQTTGEQTTENKEQTEPQQVDNTALSRIPVGENKQPVYTQASPEDTYDALVEQMGDDQSAVALAQSELDDAKKRLDKLEKDKAKNVVKGKTAQEKIQYIQQQKADIEAEKQNVSYWQSVLNVPVNRKADTEAAAREQASQAKTTEQQPTQTAETGAPEYRYDTPEAARQRGYKVVEGNRIDRQEEQPMPKGRMVEVQYSTKDKVNGILTISELGDVQGSHLTNGQRNDKHFLPEAQPKAEFGADRQAAAQTNANEANFRPELTLTFNDTQSAYSGSAPQTNRRGEVIQGNGRRNLAEYVYAPGNEKVAQRYREYLMAHAADFGMTAEDIAKMDKPFAHIVLDVNDDEAIRLGQFTAQDLETGGKKIPEVSSTVTKLGDRFSNLANILLKHDDPDATPSERIETNMADAVQWLNRGGFINDTEAKTLLEDKAASRQFMKDVLTDTLFNGASPDLRTMFYELPKNIQSAILSAVGREVTINPESSILKDIQESIQAYHELITSSPQFAGVKGKNFEERKRAANTAVNDWLRQINIDGSKNTEKYSNFALELAKLYQSLKDQKTLATRLRDYYDLVAGSTRQLGMFDEEQTTGPVTKEEAIKQIFDIDYDGRQGTVPLASNVQGGEEGREGGTDNNQTGERTEGGEGSADTGGGNTVDAAEEVKSEIDKRHKEEYDKYIKPLLNLSDEQLQQLAKKKEDAVGGDLNKLAGDKEYSAIKNVLAQREWNREIEDIKGFIENTIDDDDVTFVDKASITEIDKLQRLIDEGGIDDPGDKIEKYVKQLRKKYPVTESQESVNTENPVEAINQAAEQFRKEQEKNAEQLGFTFEETPQEVADKENAEKLIDKSLTEEEIDASDTSDVNKTLAKAYLNGNHGVVQQAAYLNIYNHVRNTRQRSEADSLEAGSERQLAGKDDSRESGLGRTGEQTSGLASGGDVSGQYVGGSESKTVQHSADSKNIVPESSSERGSDSVPESEQTRLDGVHTGSEQSGGRSGNRGEGHHVRSDGAAVGRDRVADKTKRGNAKAPAGSDAAIEASKQRLAELRKKFKKAKHNGELSLSLVGMNSEQIGILMDITTEAANLGYQYLAKGLREFKEWNNQMLSDFHDWLKEDMEWSDAEINDYLNEVWNCEYNIDGETRTIREWASVMDEDKLRNVVREDLKTKREKQKEAEKIDVKVGDIDNIRETLPYLLPEQQEDVLKAETQFFDPSHQDREHGNGKGMMFTNGTGTGKTYTGLGIVKRFVKQGKGRVLILTPSQPKVSDWKKDCQNLGLNIEDLDTAAKAKGTTATKAKGSGVVITTYANARQNLALLEDCFDLVVYDESHKITEGKEAAEGEMYKFHQMLTNKNVEKSIDRQTYWLPEWIEHRNLLKEREENLKTLDKLDKMGELTEEEKDLQKRLNVRMVEIEKRLEELRPIMQEIRESKRPQAEIDSKITKTVFLSATPWNTRENLKYAEGYLFSYPEEDPSTKGSYNHRSPEDAFFERYFPAGYRWRYGRLEQHVENAEALGRQEIDFSDYLQNQLGTLSGRMITSEWDYSRDFPILTLDHAGRFNQAMSEVYRNPKYNALADIFRKAFDYNYSTALFEAMKTSLVIERIKEHLKRGQKVVVFHRRRTSGDLEPPFERALQAAELAAGLARQHGDTAHAEEMEKAIRAFRKDFADMLEWEKALDYSLPRDQIAAVFGEDNVAFFSGAETSKTKNKSVEDFMKDKGGKDIIVIQEASGKEGISLHDQTGEHQRVETNLALPQSPIAFIQIEGRIYRIGQKSNAIFEYPLLGLDLETSLFAQRFNSALGTTENLALGSKARNLRQSIANAVLENTGEIDYDRQGYGGKDMDGQVDSRGTKDGFDNAISDYYGNHKIRKNRGDREGFDYFPTPEPVGWKMVQWAQLMEGESVLEPSAGHGAIARYVPESNPLTAIEPSAELYSKLQMRAGGPGRRFEEKPFEDYSLTNKHDAIVMNPPYGVQGKMAMDHVAKAFKHLNEGGRLIAIIPAGPAMEKRFNTWLESTGNDGVNGSAVVTGEVILPDVAFSRAGTSVRTRIVVIDKVTRPKMREGMPSKVTVDLSEVKDVEEMFERLRNVNMPVRTIDQSAIAQKRALKTKKALEDNKFVKEVWVDEDGIVAFNRSTRGVPDLRINFENIDNPAHRKSLLQQYNSLKEARDNAENVDYGKWSGKTYGSGKNAVPAVDAIRDYCDTAIKTIANVLKTTEDGLEKEYKAFREEVERKQREEQERAEREFEERRRQREEALKPIIETALRENADNETLSPDAIEHNIKAARGTVFDVVRRARATLHEAGIDWRTGHKITDKFDNIEKAYSTDMPIDLNTAKQLIAIAENDITQDRKDAARRALEMSGIKSETGEAKEGFDFSAHDEYYEKTLRELLHKAGGLLSLKTKAQQAEEEKKSAAEPRTDTKKESYEYKLDKNTRTGEDMHLVVTNERVDNATYKDLQRKAKALNDGYYNRFKKAWHFKTEEDARQFMEQAKATGRRYDEDIEEGELYDVPGTDYQIGEYGEWDEELEQSEAPVYKNGNRVATVINAGPEFGFLASSTERNGYITEDFYETESDALEALDRLLETGDEHTGNEKVAEGYYSVEEAQAKVDELSSKYPPVSHVGVTHSKCNDKELFSALFGKNVAELMFAMGGPRVQEAIDQIRKVLGAAGEFDGGFVHLLDKIIIFADRISKDRFEESYFHENIHAFLNKKYGDITEDGTFPLREIAERFWNSTPEQAGITSKEFVRRAYKNNPKVWAEEFFTYCVSRAMTEGRFDIIDKYITDEADRKELEEILNALNYDRARESESRAGESGTNGENEERRYSIGDSRQISKKKGKKVSEQKSRIAQHIDNLLKKLGTKNRTKVYHSLDEVPEDERKHIEQRHRQGRKVRGWYENGQIYLFLPDIESEYEAERTIWHETVAHHGLRNLIGEENYDKLLKKLWLEYKDGEMGKWVTERMQRNGWSLNEAIDEYLAREAEKNPFKQPGLWQRLQWWLSEILHKMGFGTDPTISDIQYLFWQSQNQLKENDPMSKIKQQAFLHNLNRSLEDAPYINLNAETEEDIENPEAEDAYDDGIRHSEETDEEVIERLEKEPKVKVYRAMQLIDGKLYPPMAAKQGGKLVNPIELGKWEKADEHPEMADNNGKFKLDKGNGKSLKAAYNPYIHTSTSMLNDQFSEAQSRPNLVVVEAEVPESELTSGYKAEKAKDSVGKMDWKAGIVQGQLSGTREVILSRWDKPIRIVPVEEVAKSIADQIKGKVDVMPSNVVTPQQREALEKEGVKFVETDNQGKITEGENKGKTYSSVYGRRNGRRYDEDIDDPVEYSARKVYEERLNTVSYVFSESFIDGMVGVKRGMYAISGGKDVPDSQNVYMQTGLVESKTFVEQKEYEYYYVKPLENVLRKIKAKTGWLSGDIDRYVFTKSGLERNRVFYIRDWMKEQRDVKISGVEMLSKAAQDIFERKEMAIKDRYEAGEIDNEQKEKMLKAALQEAHNEYLDNIQSEFNKMTDKNYDDLLKNKKTFPQYLDDVDNFIRNNIDASYQANEHDYSGFTEMYGDEEGKFDEADILNEMLNMEKMMDANDNVLSRELWTSINRCSQYGLDKYRTSGMMSNESYDRISKMFHWYVPMRGFKEGVRAEDHWQYMDTKKSNSVGGLLKKAKGRKSKAMYPIATLILMNYKAINDCNQNIVKQYVWRLCQANNNDLVVTSDAWVVLDPKTDQWVVDYPDIKEDATAEEVLQAVEEFNNRMNELKEKKQARRIKGKAKFPYLIDEARKREHVVDVMINGEYKRMIIVGKPRMAQALNGKTKFKSGSTWWNRYIAQPMMRYMRAISTSYNLTFVPRNMSRDWTHFSAVLLSKEGAAYTAAAERYYFQTMPRPYKKGIFIGKEEEIGHKNGMIGLFKKWRNGTLDMNVEIERDFKDFMEHGGITGYVHIQNLEKYRRKMRKALGESQKDENTKGGNRLTEALSVAGEKTRFALRHAIKFNGLMWECTLGAVEAMNEAIENNARFATYRASRHYAGRTRDRSAYDAKEVTANFNRMGAGNVTSKMKSDNKNVVAAAHAFGLASQILRSNRMFVNATIQGIMSAFRGLHTKEGGFNKKYAAKLLTRYAGIQFMLGFAMPYVNGLLMGFGGAGGDDDDNQYANLADWVRRKNLCLSMGWATGDMSDFLVIPLGQELAAFYTLGDMMAGLTYAPNLKPVNQTLFDEVVGFLSVFSPVDFDKPVVKDWEDKDLVEKGVSGILGVGSLISSPLAPVLQVYENYSWTGRPIYQEDVYPDDKHIPEYLRANWGTNPMYVGMSKWLNDASGGDDVTRGDMQINPSAFEYLVNQYTGGPGKFLGSSVSLGRDAKEYIQAGEAPDFNVKKIEGVRAFWNKSDENTQNYRISAKYYAYKKKADKLKYQLSKYNKKGDFNLAHKLKGQFLELGPEYARLKLIEQYNKTSKKEGTIGLKDQLDEARKLRGEDRKEAMMSYNMRLSDLVEKLDSIGNIK